MIIKERKRPLHLLQLEALARRLPTNHPKKAQIEADLARYKAGYQGEKALDFHLSFLDDTRYKILHDLRLYDGQHHFQIDTLLISPSFILILEVKNISGTIIFDTKLNQLIRKQNNNQEGFSDPITQAKRQIKQLISWFSKRNLSSPPLDFLIIVSSPSTIIELSPPSSTTKVIHAASLLDKMNLIENNFQDEKLTEKDSKKMIRLLLKDHSANNSSILEKYKISIDELQKGVMCPSCSYIPMRRAYGKWFCPSCRGYSLEAHISSINDYFLLIDVTINNQMLRDFLNINSRHVAKHLLLNMNLHSSGSNKGKIYYAPDFTNQI